MTNPEIEFQREILELVFTTAPHCLNGFFPPYCIPGYEYRFLKFRIIKQKKIRSDFHLTDKNHSLNMVRITGLEPA